MVHTHAFLYTEGILPHCEKEKSIYTGSGQHLRSTLTFKHCCWLLFPKHILLISLSFSLRLLSVEGRSSVATWVRWSRCSWYNIVLGWRAKWRCESCSLLLIQRANYLRMCWRTLRWLVSVCVNKKIKSGPRMYFLNVLMETAAVCFRYVIVWWWIDGLSVKIDQIWALTGNGNAESVYP